jgi:uncharacterized membrane protein
MVGFLALVGFFVGLLVDGISTGIALAIIAGAIGFVMRPKRDRTVGGLEDTKPQPLENRVSELEHRVQQLERQLSTMQTAGAVAKEASASPPEPSAEAYAQAPEPLLAAAHGVRGALLMLVLASEARWAVGLVAKGSWPLAGALATISLTLFAIAKTTANERSHAIPQWTLPRDRYTQWLLPAWSVLVLAVVLVRTLPNAGDASPLPTFPLLNPLELTSLFAFSVAAICLLRGSAQWPARGVVSGTLSVVAFVLLNAVLLRAVHHSAGVPYAIASITDHPIAQMVFSIAWAGMGIVAMVWAHRKGTHVVWMVGLVLLAFVVGKLFFMDLRNTSGFERVISFIVVGLLILAVGYFAPVPPAAKSRVDSHK